MRPSCLRCAQISEQFLSWLFTDRVMIEQVAHNNKKMRRCQSDRQAGLFCILTGCICDLRVCEFGRLRPNFDRIRESNFLLLRESVATIKYCAPFFSFLFLTSRTCYSPQVDFLIGLRDCIVVKTRNWSRVSAMSASGGSSSSANPAPQAPKAPAAANPNAIHVSRVIHVYHSTPITGVKAVVMLLMLHCAGPHITKRKSSVELYPQCVVGNGGWLGAGLCSRQQHLRIVFVGQVSPPPSELYTPENEGNRKKFSPSRGCMFGWEMLVYISL